MNTTTPAAKVVNPSPKMRFMSSPSQVITSHQEMIHSDQFSMSADYALLDLVRTIVNGTVGTNEALAGFYQIQGAHRLLQSMIMLAEKPSPQKVVTGDQNLDHRV